MNFNDARYIARMNIREIADYLELSLSTVQKYQKTDKAPKAIIECLLMIGGELPRFAMRRDFTGWSFGSGYLWTPEGERFTAGDIRAGRIASKEFERLHRESVRNRQKAKEAKPSNIIHFPINGRNSKLHEPERVKNNDGL